MGYPSLMSLESLPIRATVPRGTPPSLYVPVRGMSHTAITAATLQEMSRHVQHALGDRWNRLGRLTQNLNERQTIDLAFKKSKEWITYTPDYQIALTKGYPADTEVLINPLLYLERKEKRGDCDDFSMLIASFCVGKGIDTRWVVIRERHSTEWNHVYVACYVGGGRIALDGAFGPYVGWEVTEDSRYDVIERMEIPV